MAGLHPFNYGNVVSTGENILNSRYARDPNNPRNQLLRPGAGYGDINWGQFTPESIKAHHAAGGGPENANLLVRTYAPQIVEIDGLLNRVSRNSDNTMSVEPIPLEDLDTKIRNEGLLAGNKAYSTGAGGAFAEAGQPNPYAVQPQELNMDVQQGKPATQPTAQPAPVTPPPAAQLAADKAEKVATAKETSEVKADLSRMKSNMPGLLKSVERLRGFSGKASYTMAGKAWDETVKQTGFGATEGSVARASFIATIDNQILPLLRQTFGAAFTEAEGETLKKSLADPDASHEERMAQLDAFILQKKENVLAKEAQLRSGNTDETYEQRRARILGQ